MFTILELYDRTTLWDEMVANSTLSDLTDLMISYAPGEWVMAAIELSPSRADDLFQNLPVTYHVTDYLNAILNYPAFGTSYYNNIVNQLMTLGYVGGGWSYFAGEHHIYGSSRVGVHQTDLLMRSRFADGDISITLEDVEYTSLYRGKRHYELSNHLGNVQVVVSDKRISVCDEELEVAYFKADVLSAMDYYPFGMMMPDRQWYAGSDSSGYRFGFQNQEKDNEISGVGNSISFKYRIHDSRLGRFLSIDPLSKKYPYNSPYAFSQNRVIDGIELEGLEVRLLSNDVNVTAALTVTLSKGVTWDTKGNVATFTSHGVGGSISVGVSTGVCYAYFPSMPDISFAAGEGWEAGISYGFPIGYQGGAAIVQSSGYYGIAIFNGFGAGAGPGAAPYAQETFLKFEDGNISSHIYLSTLSEGYSMLGVESQNLQKQIEKYQLEGAQILNEITQLENALLIQTNVDNYNLIASELHNKNTRLNAITNGIKDLEVEIQSIDNAQTAIVDEIVRFQTNQQEETKAENEKTK